jgi:hypothetical protein
MEPRLSRSLHGGRTARRVRVARKCATVAKAVASAARLAACGSKSALREPCVIPLVREKPAVVFLVASDMAEVQGLFSAEGLRSMLSVSSSVRSFRSLKTLHG